MTPPTPPAAPKKFNWLVGCVLIPFVLFGLCICLFAGIIVLGRMAYMPAEELTNMGYGIALAAASIFVLALAYTLIRGAIKAKTNKARIGYLVVLGILALFSCLGSLLVVFFQNYTLVW